MKKRDDFDETVQAVAATWVKLYRAQMVVSAQALSTLPRHTTHGQLAVMEALDSLGPMCMREISDKILKTAGNVTVVVDTLEKRGFVKRECLEGDRRKLMVHITPEGHEWLSRVLLPCMQRVVEQFSSLSEEERNELGRLCRKLGLGRQGDGPDEEGGR